MKKFYIYKITNLITNKIYVGQTFNLYDRIKAHKACRDKGTIITKSINKYGWENHKIEILFTSTNITRAEADEIEIYYISLHNSYCKNNPLGMNLTVGGFKGSISKKTYELNRKNGFDKWRNKLGKANVFLKVIDTNGEVIAVMKGLDYKNFLIGIGIAGIHQHNSIKVAISKKGWALTGKKYIVGFEDDDIYEKFIKSKKDRINRVKNTPMTEKRVNALLDHHKKTHTIPILDVNTGFYFESIKEFAAYVNLNHEKVKTRFRRGDYDGKYILCKN